MNGGTTTLVWNVIVKTGFPGAWLNWYWFRLLCAIGFCSDSFVQVRWNIWTIFWNAWQKPVIPGLCRPSMNIWPSTGVTTCRINFNFTDTIHVVHPIHYTVKRHYNACHYNANASLTRSILGSQTAPSWPSLSGSAHGLKVWNHRSLIGHSGNDTLLFPHK